jgi:hypothetical protein
VTAWCLLLGVAVLAAARPLARVGEVAGAAAAGVQLALPVRAAPALVWTVRLVGLLVAAIGLAAG